MFFGDLIYGILPFYRLKYNVLKVELKFYTFHYPSCSTKVSSPDRYDTLRMVCPPYVTVRLPYTSVSLMTFELFFLSNDFLVGRRFESFVPPFSFPQTPGVSSPVCKSSSPTPNRTPPKSRQWWNSISVTDFVFTVHSLSFGFTYSIYFYQITCVNLYSS